MIAQYSDLKGKSVLVTGALRGLGLGMVEELARQGAHVVFNYRPGKEDAARDLKARLKELGACDVDALAFDVTQNAQIVESINHHIKEKGPITGLVNNAGISKDQIVLRLKEEDIAQTLDTNLKGAMLVSVALSRSFLKAENVSVVNISSVVGQMGNPSQIAYAASKAGLLGFTKSFAKELGSRNIRCNAICPGFINTDMTDSLDEKVKQVYLSQIPLGRFGNAQEVAELTCFLLSKASSYITGEVITIAGGLYM